MKSILAELWDRYNNLTSQMKLEREIDEYSHALKERLGKRERRLLLGIVDTMDVITEIQTRESFISGFHLAWRLLTELHIYDSDRLIEEELNSNGHCFMQRKENDDEI